jgi:hypothetical protein
LTIHSIRGIRARAYTRPPRKDEAALPPGTGRVTLHRLNKVFLLDESFTPSPSQIHWNGKLELKGEGPAARIPADGR